MPYKTNGQLQIREAHSCRNGRHNTLAKYARAVLLPRPAHQFRPDAYILGYTGRSCR